MHKKHCTGNVFPTWVMPALPRISQGPHSLWNIMQCAKRHCIMLHSEFCLWLPLGRAGMTAFIHACMLPWLIPGMAGMIHEGNTFRERLDTFMFTPEMCFLHESCQPCLESAKDRILYGTLCNAQKNTLHNVPSSIWSLPDSWKGWHGVCDRIVAGIARQTYFQDPGT